ncbi:hypothetical protein GGR57DRAFT_482779 [Xylariaceae sp. FL1272]|nr:hypothetical protein GGR57DRAFT_482779 [Xylariaceae sp. FL1272]
METSDEADPVVASYKVYVSSTPTNPTIARRVLVLQHPNRRGHHNHVHPHLSEVRLKPKSSMIEVDVPMSFANTDYDRDKGQRWGAALAKSTNSKNGGGHGLSGGFGVGVSALRPNKRRDDFDREVDMLSWNEAVRQDKVLRTQTLGGQIPTSTKITPNYMVGVFVGDQLHLTPVSAVVSLRPQLHHIDAMYEQSRGSRGGVGSSGGASKDDAGAGAGGTARAIHMSIKSADTSGNGELTTETMADRLRVIQTEAWRKLKYQDPWEHSTYNVFESTLQPLATTTQPAQGEKGKGKGKEIERNTIDVDSSDSEQLQTEWDSTTYFKAVCGTPVAPQDGVIKTEPQIKKEVQDDPMTGAKGKGRATATTAPKKTPNTKGKSVAFDSDAMDTRAD